MSRTKTVTPSKIGANRANAKRSTGPRTERGKRNAKFNAVTLGLFAKHVVIPVCDGYKAERDFKSLLDGLHPEFQPVGLYEEWLVVKIAECMWRLRRATRCESGSVRESAIWADHSDSDSLISKLTDKVSVLRRAEEQLRDFGTLSQKTYEQVAPFVENEKSRESEAEKDNRLVERDFDRQSFLTYITKHRESLESFCDALVRTEVRRSDVRLDYHALPPEEDMDQILRYEERMHRQVDWAVQRLLEHQERRKTLQYSADAT
jgi:hypothetical protein